MAEFEQEQPDQEKVPMYLGGIPTSLLVTTLPNSQQFKEGLLAIFRHILRRDRPTAAQEVASIEESLRRESTGHPML